MTKQPKAVRAWAVWSSRLNRPYVDSDGHWQIFHSRTSAKAAADRWYGDDASVVSGTFTPGTPIRRGKRRKTPPRRR